MSNLINLLPRFTNDQIETIIQNTINHSSGGGDRAASEVAMRAVEAENRRRFEQLPNGSVGDSYPATGMMAAYGYRVGNRGAKEAYRRKALDCLMQSNHLLALNSQSYVRSWGRPGSGRRYKRILNFLDKRASTPSQTNQRAVSEWRADLEYLESKWAAAVLRRGAA